LFIGVTSKRGNRGEDTPVLGGIPEQSGLLGAPKLLCCLLAQRVLGLGTPF